MRGSSANLVIIKCRRFKTFASFSFHHLTIMIDADIAKATSNYGSLNRDLDEDNPMVQSDRVLQHRQRERVTSIFVATFIAALGPASFGYCLAYSSSAFQDLHNLPSTDPLYLSSEQGSWFSSLVTIGAMLGGPIGGYLIEALGRKGAIMGSSVPFLVGWMLIAFASHVSMLHIGRFITGMGCGAISLAVPVYIAEISTARLRGGLGSANQLAVTLGLLFSYTMGVFVSWKWLAIVGAMPPTLLVMLMFFMPETPRWLLGRNRRHEALKSMQWLRGPQADVEQECYEIESNLDTSNRMSWSEFCKPSIAKPLFVGIGLMVFQQFCGINAVIFNAATIFDTAGIHKPKQVAIIIGAVQFVGTAIACLIIDRTGRRILLMAAGVVMFLCLIALGVYFEIYIPTPTKNSTVTAMPHATLFHSSISKSVPAEKIAWLSITSLVVYNLAFALAWGPIPWLMMSEIFPIRARGLASGITTLSNWFFAFLVTKTFATMITTITTQGTYWLYGGFAFMSFIFVYFAVPETRGKTLEEIEALFDSSPSSLYSHIDSDEE